MDSSRLPAATAEFALRHHGAFSGRASGLTPSALSRLVARGFLRRAARGVYVVAGAPRTWRQRVMIAQLAAAGSVAIGCTAARLHGLDGFDTDELVHLAVVRGGRAPGARTSHTLHSYPPEDIVVIDGIRCTGMARTLCDLAGLDRRRYERAADDAQRRGVSLTWIAATAARLRVAGRAGPSVALADVQRRGEGGRVRDSWFEALVERLVRSAKVPEVVRQYEIVDDQGRFVARVDLAIPSLRIAIEAHSRRFHTGPAREARDEHRDHAITGQGWVTMYLGWADTTRSPAAVIRRVEQLAAVRATHLRAG